MNENNKELKHNDQIKFYTKHYFFKGYLGKGGCGETIKLYNSTLNQYFACKKYQTNTVFKINF